MKDSSAVPPAKSGEHYDYAIIGMRIGGLTLGALLVHTGHKVIIFEQHYVPGGYGHTFHQGDFSFCAELHYVWDCGPGERVHQMLAKLGLEQRVTFRRLDPDGFDRIVGPGVDYTIGSGFEREHQRLSAMFPAHAGGLKIYYELIGPLHRELYELPLGFSGRTSRRSPGGRRFVRGPLPDAGKLLDRTVHHRTATCEMARIQGFSHGYPHQVLRPATRVAFETSP